MSALLLRLDLRDGTTKWRSFPSHEHATHHGQLCAAFGLDPIRTSFDLPSTARGAGSSRGDGRRGPRLVNGYVMWGARAEPIGVLTFAQAGEQFPDVDPQNLRDFFNLGHKIR